MSFRKFLMLSLNKKFVGGWPVPAYCKCGTKGSLEPSSRLDAEQNTILAHAGLPAH